MGSELLGCRGRRTHFGVLVWRKGHLDSNFLRVSCGLAIRACKFVEFQGRPWGQAFGVVGGVFALLLCIFTLSLCRAKRLRNSNFDARGLHLGVEKLQNCWVEEQIAEPELLRCRRAVCFTPNALYNSHGPAFMFV